MSEPVKQSEVEDVLSSIRRLVGNTKVNHLHRTERRVVDRLVLSPQLRVEEDPKVLRLTPEDAVSAPQDWQEYEEPPLQLTDPVTAPVQPSGARSTASDTTPAKPALRTDVSELTAKIAALEMAIAKTRDQWEPDGAGRDAYAGTQTPAMAWQENVELDATGRPVNGATSDAVRGAAPKAGDPVLAIDPDRAEDILEGVIEEQVIDEEMLRALVAEIVRSELQGDLGERITRNVRKLVRREIHRALASQALE